MAARADQTLRWPMTRPQIREWAARNRQPIEELRPNFENGLLCKICDLYIVRATSTMCKHIKEKHPRSHKPPGRGGSNDDVVDFYIRKGHVVRIMTQLVMVHGSSQVFSGAGTATAQRTPAGKHPLAIRLPIDQPSKTYRTLLRRCRQRFAY